MFFQWSAHDGTVPNSSQSRDRSEQAANSKDLSLTTHTHGYVLKFCLYFQQAQLAEYEVQWLARSRAKANVYGLLHRSMWSSASKLCHCIDKKAYVKYVMYSVCILM